MAEGAITESVDRRDAHEKPHVSPAKAAGRDVSYKRGPMTPIGPYKPSIARGLPASPDFVVILRAGFVRRISLGH
ncbi:MAG TPA: hypothetical protein VJN90_05675 [Candidatus Acidoferrales bacterium]|nr:hypothetical protein [Candidatus Acidoferrales bacterium]